MNVLGSLAVFIDGGYLVKLLESLGVDRIKNVNFGLFCRDLGVYSCNSKIPDHIFYYDAIHDRTETQKNKFPKSIIELRILEISSIPEINIKLGEAILCGGKFKQKGVDVLLALDCQELLPTLQEVVLVSGDLDFLPIIRRAKLLGVKTRVVCGNEDSYNPMLVSEADDFLKLRPGILYSLMLKQMSYCYSIAC